MANHRSRPIALSTLFLIYFVSFIFTEKSKTHNVSVRQNKLIAISQVFGFVKGIGHVSSEMTFLLIKHLFEFG